MRKTSTALLASIALIGCQASEDSSENEETVLDEPALEEDIDTVEDYDATDSSTSETTTPPPPPPAVETSGESSTTSSTDDVASVPPPPPMREARPSAAKKDGPTSHLPEAKAPPQSKTAPQNKPSPEREGTPPPRP